MELTARPGDGFGRDGLVDDRGGTAAPGVTPDAVFITGATGFLGGFVCTELLRQTTAAVFCLVRGRSIGGARQRLARHLAIMGAPDPERTVVVLGDLTRPRFGLTPEEFTRLADTVGSVYHCAATTSLALGYEHLVPVNVRGTNEVLRFARHRQQKALHHVSTLGVFIRGRACGMLKVRETTMPTESSAGPTGYHQSKVVAERAVLRAANLGLEVSVYRSGLLLADSVTGLSQETSVGVRLIKAAIVVGQAPTTESSMYVGTPDHVARSIVALSLSPDAAGRIFHLTNPRPFPTRDFLRHARDQGYHLSDVTIPEWWDSLARAMDEPAAVAVLALREPAKYLLRTDIEYRIPDLDCEDTSRALAALGITYPTLDSGFFKREFLYLIERGILPPPPIGDRSTGVRSGRWMAFSAAGERMT